MSALLWTLLALFVARVVGQMLVAFYSVDWLPPMERWYSGLMPYEYLLPSQLVLIALMAKVCADFTRRLGFFYAPRPFFATWWLWLGFVYLMAMLLRWPLQAYYQPDAPWIPIPFHWVLAAFVIAVGLSHRDRLRARNAPH